MPRVRQKSLGVVLSAGSLLAGLLMAFGAPSPALVQTSDPDFSLLSPIPEGDPRNLQRFRSPGTSATDPASRIGQAQTFGTEAASGAGTTGYNSTNTKKKDAKTPPKPKASNTPASVQLPPPPVSALLPTAGAAKLPQNQARPGRPPRDDGITPTPTTGALPVPIRKPPPEDDPFAPTGIATGSFLLKPAIETTAGYDSNAGRTTTPKASWFWVVAPELLVNSNWSRHELTATIRGSYTDYVTQSQLNRPNFEGRVNGRVDVTRDTILNLEGRMLVFTDNPGSPNIQADLAKLPLATDLGATAGILQHFNRFDVSLKESIDRTTYQSSSFVDGETASNNDRNFNQYLTLLRLSYELTPGVKPYVEFSGDQRVHDLFVDRSGMERNSSGFSGKAGTTFELSRTLTGEIAAGYLTRIYKDPTLQSLGGFSFDSSLVWLATALTTVKLTATTTANETTLVGVSGIFSRDTTLEVDHAFRRWLIATLKFTRGFDVYQGSSREDVRYAGSAALTYKLTRDLQLKTELRREWRTSNQFGNDYLSNAILFGLRLQR